MKIILVRHGHVEGITPERFRGRAELPLTPLGRRQAQALATRIGASWKPVAVYASPLERAAATAELIASPLGLRAELRAEITDIDYGAWQGRTPAEARRNWPRELDLWFHAPQLARIPGGESLGDVAVRVTQFVCDLASAYGDDTVVIVGHDSVNRVLLLGALDLPLSHYWRIEQAPAALNELAFDGERFVVVSLNETFHLHDVREV